MALHCNSNLSLDRSGENGARMRGLSFRNCGVWPGVAEVGCMLNTSEDRNW